MLATAQCQKPLAVGASGSYTVTAKLCVPSGKPDQDSCGERSSPPAPITPLTCGWGRTAPSVTSVLVTVNEGTCGRKSYGFGGSGRSAMSVLSTRGRAERTGGGAARPRRDPRQGQRVAPVGTRPWQRRNGAATSAPVPSLPCLYPAWGCPSPSAPASSTS